MNTKRMKGCESEMMYRGRVKNKNDEHTKKGPTKHNKPQQTTTSEDSLTNLNRSCLVFGPRRCRRFGRGYGVGRVGGGVGRVGMKRGRGRSTGSLFVRFRLGRIRMRQCVCVRWAFACSAMRRRRCFDIQLETRQGTVFPGVPRGGVFDGFVMGVRGHGRR